MELHYLQLHYFQNIEGRPADWLLGTHSQIPESYGILCVHIVKALICNFKIQSQISSSLFKKSFQYCFPRLPLISQQLLLLNFYCTVSSIFIAQFSFPLLCYLTTEEILPLVGRTAHFETCRWERLTKENLF